MTYLLDTDTVIYLMRGLRIMDAKTARQQQWQVIGLRIFEHFTNNLTEFGRVPGLRLENWAAI